jgi:hypothetical protein
MSATLGLAAARPGGVVARGDLRGHGPAALWNLARREPALLVTGLAIAALMAPTIVALVVETRTLAGLNVWIKPLKFDASIAVLLATYAIGLGLARADDRRRPVVRGLVALLVLAAVLEAAYITLQAARGEHSHFNDTSRWEAIAYSLMGVFAVVLTAGAGLAAVLVWRAGSGGLGVGLWTALVAGFALSCALGLATGFAIAGNGGHFVAAAGAMPGSDAGGIALFGWSRTVGDLRVAHFLGLHVMQVLPLIGWAADRIAPRAARGVVLAGGLAMAGLTVWALVWARAGLSVVPAGW